MNSKTMKDIIEMFGGRSVDECELIIRTIMIGESIKNKLDTHLDFVGYSYENGHAMRCVPSELELKNNLKLLSEINDML